MRFQIRLYATAVLAILLLLAAVPSEASILGSYNDRATWEGLTTGRVDINFDSLGLSAGGFTSYSTSTGLTIGDVTFTGWQTNQYNLYALNPLTGWAENFESGTLIRGPWYNTDSYLQVTFGTSITSFALDLMTMLGDGQSFEVFVDGISAGVVVTGSQPTRTFFGVQTDTAITEIRIYLNSGTLFQTQGLFDNIAIGLVGTNNPPPPGETPEVGTLLYTGAGLALLVASRRRLSRQRPLPVLA